MKPTLLSYAGLASLLHMGAADSEPFLSYDVNTIKDCSFWYDNYGTRTCESIRETWSISPETFSRWNPSISLDCKGWGRHSYCVGVIAELTRSSSTITPTSTSTTTTLSTPPPIWTDHGCYADASVHPFQTQLPAPAGKDMTRAKCEAKCWGEGYQFVGFKAGTECWCGNYVQGMISPSPSDCSAPCAGNSSEICGGDKVFNVLEGNDPPSTPAPGPSTSTTTTTQHTSSTVPPASETAFILMSHAKGDCTGDVTNEVLVHSDSDGTCIDTNCQVASLDIASLGSCPDGQVQISYWQQPGCTGAWYGYGYASRHTCRQLWSGGGSFKSLHLRCAKRSDDCVSKKSCTVDPEPTRGICSGPDDTTAFRFKSRYHTDCTGDQHNDVTIQSNTDGSCVDLDCKVGSLDIAAEGNCPNGQVQISYWEKTGCQGAWYGYGYADKGTCRGLWRDGNVSKSVHMRCADPKDDCVSKGQCKVDPEPSGNAC